MKKSSNIAMIRKISGLVILILMLGSIRLLANNLSTNEIKIVFNNGYEYKTVTTKNTVADVLKEKKIILKDNEKTIPALDEKLIEGQKIRIVPIDYEEEQISEEVKLETFEEILSQYEDTKEVIEVNRIEIPFETIVKKVTEDATESDDSRVLQEGKNGIKEVKYKVKYVSGQETSRELISETVIEEPVSKIVQISKKVTSRGSVTRTGAGTWSYSSEDFDLLCAITCQEGGSSYESALAVITTACNRTESSKWAHNGSDPLSQFKAKGQFCYTIDTHWRKRLNGNYPGFVAQAVSDALNGKRNHNFLSFNAAYTGRAGTLIGGNVYFNPMN